MVSFWIVNLALLESPKGATESSQAIHHLDLGLIISVLFTGCSGVPTGLDFFHPTSHWVFLAMNRQATFVGPYGTGMARGGEREYCISGARGTIHFL